MCNEKNEPDTKTSLFRFTHPLKPIGVILPQGVSKEDYNRSAFCFIYNRQRLQKLKLKLDFFF